MINALPQGPEIITKNGRPCAALVEIERNGDLEAFLIAHHPRLVAGIDRGARQRGGTPLEAVERAVSQRERKMKRRAA
jgi:antitoxin (DNA-binding transcriptional repressor) of toxin-antitoxin stability system